MDIMTLNHPEADAFYAALDFEDMADNDCHRCHGSGETRLGGDCPLCLGSGTRA